MSRLAGLLWQTTYLRYMGASVIALGIDLSLFFALQMSAVPLMLVSAISYSAGIGAHWLVSSRQVFITDLQPVGAARARQQTLFVASAIVGLIVTIVLVNIGVGAGLDARIAKLIAVVISFQLVYLIRAKVVFA